ncbi:MAG: MFS transporter [Bacillota bacterium]
MAARTRGRQRPSHLRDDRINYAIFFADSFGYPLAFSLISPTTIMPLLLTKLGASNLAIGMLPALASLGAFLPGLLSAAYLQKIPVKKHMLVAFGMVERTFVLSMAVGLMLWAADRPHVAVTWILASWTMMNLVAGFILPAFHSMMAKCIRPEQRGGMIGWSGALAGIGGVFAAQAAGAVLSHMPFPVNYSMLFVAAFVILSATILPFLATREPADQTPEEPRSVGQYVRDAMGAVKSNKGYSSAISALSVMSFALMAASFYSTYAVRNLGAGATEVARFAAITVGASVVSFPVLGRIADRHGHKRVLQVAAMGYAAAAALALASTSVNGISAVLVLASLGSTGLAVSQNVIWAEFAPSHADVPMYTAVSLLFLMPFRVAAPVVAGWIADVWGFPAIFWAALVAGAAAFAILHAAVPEPRAMNSPALDL